MNVAAVNNDAISSMSGYNYQGKMMLLCALQKSKEILDDNKDIKDYWAEIEAKEDFVLGSGGENTEQNQEFFQVKAMLSSKDIKAYAKDTKSYGKVKKSPLYKLLDARNAADPSKKSKCLLISAIDIKDWDNRKNYSPEFQEIELYQQ